MTNKTNSGASSMRGSPGVSASPIPAIIRRIVGATLIRRAITATATMTASRRRRVWMVFAIGHIIMLPAAMSCDGYRNLIDPVQQRLMLQERDRAETTVRANTHDRPTAFRQLGKFFDCLA